MEIQWRWFRKQMELEIVRAKMEYFAELKRGKP